MVLFLILAIIVYLFSVDVFEVDELAAKLLMGIWAVLVSLILSLFISALAPTICLNPTETTYQIAQLPTGNYITPDKEIMLKDDTTINLLSDNIRWNDSYRSEVVKTSYSATWRSYFFWMPVKIPEPRYEFYVPLEGASVGLQ